MLALYIILGISLLILLILLLKVKIIISYEGALQVYLKFAFFKKRIFPPSSKKQKKKTKKKQTSNISAPSEKKADDNKKDNSVVSQIWAMREILLNTIAKFLGKLHFKLMKLNIVVAGSNAAATALLYGAATQGVAYLIEILDTISNVDVSKKSEISVKSDFISQKSFFEGKIVLYISVVHIIYVGLHFLKKLIKFKINTEE